MKNSLVSQLAKLEQGALVGAVAANSPLIGRMYQLLDDAEAEARGRADRVADVAQARAELDRRLQLPRRGIRTRNIGARSGRRDRQPLHRDRGTG